MRVCCIEYTNGAVSPAVLDVGDMLLDLRFQADYCFHGALKVLLRHLST